MELALLLALVLLSGPQTPSGDLREAVQEGVDWLVRHQEDDGSWRGSRAYVRTPDMVAKRITPTARYAMASVQPGHPYEPQSGATTAAASVVAAAVMFQLRSRHPS